MTTSTAWVSLHSKRSNASYSTSGRLLSTHGFDVVAKLGVDFLSRIVSPLPESLDDCYFDTIAH